MWSDCSKSELNPCLRLKKNKQQNPPKPKQTIKSHAMKKSSIFIPARQDDSQPGAKLTVAKAEKNPTVGERKGGNLLMKKLLAKNKAEESSQQDDDTGKRSSLAPTSSRPSVSGGSGSKLSLVGLMASRRFAKKLMNKAMEKRESTLGDGVPSVLYEPTYQLEPKGRFQPSEVLAVVKDVIDNRVKDMK